LAKLRSTLVVLGVAIGIAFSGQVSGQEDGGLDVVKVRKSFYMIAGAGGNIGVQIGSDGVVLVNTGTAKTTDQVIADVLAAVDVPK